MEKTKSSTRSRPAHNVFSLTEDRQTKSWDRFQTHTVDKQKSNRKFDGSSDRSVLLCKRNSFPFCSVDSKKYDIKCVSGIFVVIHNKYSKNDHFRSVLKRRSLFNMNWNQNNPQLLLCLLDLCWIVAQAAVSSVCDWTTLDTAPKTSETSGHGHILENDFTWNHQVK